MIANMMEECRFPRSDVAVQRQDDDVWSRHGNGKGTKETMGVVYDFF